MKKRYVKFDHWETGGKTKYLLSDSYPYEKETTLYCPFDETPILRWNDGHGQKGWNCPNCGLEYNIGSGNQEKVLEFLKDHFQEIVEKVKSLGHQRSELLEKLVIAEEKGLINKANLSEQFEIPFDELG